MTLVHPFSTALFLTAAILAIAGAAILPVALLCGAAALNEAWTVFSLSS